MSAATAKPRTWPAVVGEASAGFTGRAEVIEDTGTGQVTSPNPTAFTVAAEVDPDDVLFGDVPAGPVTVRGSTSRPTELRLRPDGPLFPPDALRQVPYWDYARTGSSQPVVVLLGDPARVRALLGPDDDLPATIIRVREWTTLPTSEQLGTVLSDLSGGPPSAVGYLAGFQLVSETAPELVEVVRAFLAIENRPASGTAGMVDELQLMAASLPGAEVAMIADLLLECWSEDADPESISAVINWFDALAGRTWRDDSARRAVVERLARRDSEREFAGEHGREWTERIHYQASVLLQAR